ncbi:hypothetical protein Ciccas_013905 [Cichlidogyrus casuarinus]|uniref:Uncharacterized protein n=1 Tax=Cichlidogyrus casuarinus TaxID=1844966 RepID=A0ABD2PKU2_9PLAT
MADYNLRQIDQVMEALLALKHSAEGLDEWVQTMDRCRDDLLDGRPGSTFLGLGRALVRKAFNPQRINLSLAHMKSLTNEMEKEKFKNSVQEFKESRSELLENLVMSELFSRAIVKNCEFVGNPYEPKRGFTHEEFIRYLLDQVTTHIDFAQSRSLAQTLFDILESILEAVGQKGESITKLVYSLVGYIGAMLSGHKLACEKEFASILQKAKSEIMDKCLLMTVQNEEVFVILSEEQSKEVADYLQSIAAAQEALDSNLVASIMLTCDELSNIAKEDRDSQAVKTKLLVRLVEMARSIPASCRSDCLSQCLEKCEDIEKINAVTIGRDQSIILMAKSVSMRNLKKIQNSMKSMKVDEKIYKLVSDKMTFVLNLLGRSDNQGQEQLESCSGDDLD